MHFFNKAFSLLAFVSTALAVEICRPQPSGGNHLITLSSDSKSGWNASLFEDKLFGATLGTVSKGNPRTLWSLWPINNGNSIAITSAYSGDGICIEGSGGPLGGLPCSSVQQKAADQIVQFFLTCLTCGVNSGKKCKFQSSLEGQCVTTSFFPESTTSLQMTDCDCADKNTKQLFDFTPV